MIGAAETEGPELAAAAASEVTPQPARRSVRRRLVQSTLFPHKSAKSELNGKHEGDKEGNADGEEAQDEEYCASQGRKRKTRKGKTTPQNKTPKKSKDKSPRSTTPKKVGASNKKSSSPLSVEKQEVSFTIPNLRLEAKLMVEEYSRIFCPKQLHPFFSSWKGSKKEKSGCRFLQKKVTNTTLAPIHVFDGDQEDTKPLDWKNWEFCENSFNGSSIFLKGYFSRIIEGSAESSTVLRFPGEQQFSSTLLLRDSKSLDQCFSQPEPQHEAPTIVSAVPSDSQVACCQVESVAEPPCETGQGFGYSSKYVAEQLPDLVQERILSSHHGSSNQLEDRLWVDKYQPKNAIEVCGNSEQVKFLNEWLRTWYQGAHQTNIDSSVDGGFSLHDPDYRCSQSDSDSESIDGRDSLKNVLLITGPVGSGKSAAIYACAKEQGFKVLEINTSDSRNGATINQRFGEALKSHSITWSPEKNRMQSQKKSTVELSLDIHNGKMVQGDSDVVEVTPIPNEDNFQPASKIFGKFTGKETLASFDRSQLKHLILFEDVDIAFAEDRGFIAAIRHIAEKAKRPVILTSNSDKPDLPANFDRLEVSFTTPTAEELLQHAQRVCSAEKASIEPQVIEQLVKSCRGDIRKTIMHLQFWCQDKKISEGKEEEGPSDQMLFDPEFLHQLFPKLMPWDFPSQLSELIEKEIRMSMSMIEENSLKADDDHMQNKFFNLHRCKIDSVKAKKEEMLSRNVSDQDFCDLKSPIHSPCDFSSSGTPISFSRHSRRKNNAVMLSDSEDEFPNDSFPLSSDKDAKDEAYLDCGLPSHCATTQNCLSLLMDTQLCSEVEKPEEKHYQCPETVNVLHLVETCKSVDVSCVPESSFVPETIIDCETEKFLDGTYCGEVANAIDVSVSNEYKENTLYVEANDIDDSMFIITHDSTLLGSICDDMAVSSQEEIEDSQPECVDTITNQCQVMDECSRIDFKQKFKAVENCGSSVGATLAEKAWKKLRVHRSDLRCFITSENIYASRILKLACGMSNLISDAEMLLSKSQMLRFLESTGDLSGVSDAFSCYNEQFYMTSTITRQGVCFYTKDIDAEGLKLDSDCRLKLTNEMLSIPDMMKVSSVPGLQIESSRASRASSSVETNQPDCGMLLNSEMKSCLSAILQSIVPSRTYMAMKGNAFHEYISSLCCISRFEASRLSNNIGKTRRRRRDRNYLTTGSHVLSAEQISLLVDSNIYGKSPYQITDSNIR